jgi:glucose/arabinose dehydrogenase
MAWPIVSGGGPRWLLLGALAALAGCHRVGHPAPPPFHPRPLATRDLFPGTTFQNPTFALPLPGAGRRWLIGEREGRLVEMSEGSGARPISLLDLRAHTLGWQDVGLLNGILHPRFGVPASPDRGFLYLWYNFTASPHPGPDPPFHGRESWTRLSRFTLDDGAIAIDPRSELVLIEQHRTNTDHMGGGMFFHPRDGFLYLSVGDGGEDYVAGNDGFALRPTEDPQHLDGELLSGVLRLDVDRRGGATSHPIRRQPHHGRTAGYYVPDDNPWIAPDGSRLEELFAVGLRNPHRMSYDPGGDRILVGDVGSDLAEEIDVVERAANFGWPFREGTERRAPPPPAILGHERLPLFSYRAAGGFSAVIGGQVYQGHAVAALRGAYLFGDNGTGQIWALPPGEGATPVEIARLPGEMRAYGGLSSFAVDHDGEAVVCVLGDNERATGTVRRLIPAPPASAPPTLAATGLFADTSALRPARRFFAYDVNVPFWSDGATKRRWLAVPEGSRITFAPRGEWRFPPGTTAIKHFEVALDERHPQITTRLETRVLTLDAAGNASGRTYRWRADGTDADLVEEAATEDLTATSRAPVGPLIAAGGPAVVSVGDGAQLSAGAGTPAFGYLSAPGDFDVAARWDAVEGGTSGLALRSTRGGGGGEALALAWTTAGGRTRLVLERSAGKRSSVLELGSVPRPRWLRLARQGHEVAYFQGEDGHHWVRLGSAAMVTVAPFVGVFAATTEAVVHASVAELQRCTAVDHLYPSSADCLSCHLAPAGWLLGVNARQWNRPARDGRGGTTNQLALASERGLFDRPVGADDLRSGHLVPLDDEAAPVDVRVRSYLDANCSHCHRPGVVVQVHFDARFDAPGEARELAGVRLRWPVVPSPRDWVILAGHPERSMLYRRLAAHQMPPLGSALVDGRAADLIRSWILGLGAL